jgi:hypothetical protein
VERRKSAGAVLHGVGTTVNVGLGVFNWGGDVKKNLSNKKSNVTVKIADSSIDTAKEGEEFVVDTAIVDAGFGLAICTFGASIVVGLGAAYVNHLVVDHVAAGAKSVVRSAERRKMIRKLSTPSENVEKKRYYSKGFVHVITREYPF